jgi:hypothetical protein
MIPGRYRIIITRFDYHPADGAGVEYAIEADDADGEGGQLLLPPYREPDADKALARVAYAIGVIERELQAKAAQNAGDDADQRT